MSMEETLGHMVVAMTTPDDREEALTKVPGDVIYLKKELAVTWRADQC